jgi:hypothetical protein
MNPPPDNFERLRKLLALKRYELPPPGYFANFPARVLRKLEAVEASRSSSWWRRLGLDFDLQPAMVCGCGVLVCALFSAGVIASNQCSQQFARPPMGAMLITSHALEPESSVPVARPMPRSTEPVLRTTSPFDQIRPRATRVSFDLQ